jgi:hypothetical protein
MRTFDVQFIEIACDYERAFHYISKPQNLVEWTAAFKAVRNGRATMRTPLGELEIGLEVKANQSFGNVDWFMTMPDGNVGRAFSRLVRNQPNATIYTFVLLAPSVPLEKVEGTLDRQMGILREELAHLREILEKA